MWCGGAREPRVSIGSLLPKDNIFSNLPAFQDLNCIIHCIIYFSKIFFTLSLNFSAEFGRFFQIVINSKVPEALAIKRTAAVKITPHENVK